VSVEIPEDVRAVGLRAQVMPEDGETASLSVTVPVKVGA
jgi:hypothetical protein